MAVAHRKAFLMLPGSGSCPKLLRGSAAGAMPCLSKPDCDECWTKCGHDGSPNRDSEVSPSDTPNRDLDGIAFRVMKIWPEESILRKKQVSPHKIGEYCCGSPRTLEFVLRCRHHAQ